ncbi:Predicted membrane protein [Nocardioides scoriae]|uniref:Predicted membrane protein n=1 Tax=Nocardioides scoriae TaxID=642780 RepID=A0A1H1X036_9ACTN|nr:DUF2206 domain-containing protein [Nocardioides scoriae]SDT02715.1 Predicted membrane protein [Nocardioides scoriae]
MTLQDTTVAPAGPAPATDPLRGDLALGATVLVAGGVLLLDVPVAVRCLLTVLLAVVVPVAALLGSPARRTPPSLAEVVTACGGSVLLLLLVGLALNTLLPVVGIDRALATAPVVVGVVLLDLGLVAWRLRQGADLARPLAAAVRSAVLWRAGTAEALALASLVICIAGAVRLNNGASSAVAVVGHALVAATFVALLLRPARSRLSDGLALYLAAAALLLGTSVRGWYVIGHDIQREFLVYLLAQGQDRWQMSSLDSAYNACLSVSVLPTVVANLTGLGGVVVFKVVLQLAFALVPVAVYAASRGWAGRRVALLGALVLVTFPTFHNDMPYLVRQEVAFLFLALALLTAARHDLRRGLQLALVVGFGVGVVLSHYSTTYLLLLGLVMGSAGFHVSRHLASRRTPGQRVRERPVLLAPVVVVAVGLATWTWVSPVTQSGGHLEETVTSTVSAVVSGSSGPGSSDLSYGLFAGRQASPDERLAMFAAETLDERRAESGAWLLDDAEAAALTPATVDIRDDALTPVGRVLDAVGLDVTRGNALLRLGAALLLQVLLLAGVALLALARFSTPRRRPGLARWAVPTETLWLVLGAIAALGLVVVVPGLSASYGVLRAFQQGLLVFAPVIVVGAVGVLGLLLARLRTGPMAVAGAGFVGLFLVLTGVVSTTTGGAPGQLALSNSGQYYDLYYLTDAEAAGTRWLARAARSAPVQSEVVTDKVAVGRLRSATGGEIEVSGEFFPTQLRRDTFVFLGAQTVEHEQATIFYTGNLITYRYPVELLEQRLDLVYSNPDAEVFR